MVDAEPDVHPGGWPHPDQIELNIPSARHAVVVTGLQGTHYKGWMDGKRLKHHWMKGLEVPRRGDQPSYVSWSAFPIGFPKLLVDGVQAARVPRPPRGYLLVRFLLVAVPYVVWRAPVGLAIGVFAFFGATYLFKRPDFGPAVRWGVPIAGVLIEIAFAVLVPMALAARG